MLQRVLIVYIAGILLCDFLLGLGPWQEGKSQGQGAFVSVQTLQETAYCYSDTVRSVCSGLLAQAGLKPSTVALAQGVLLGDKHLINKEQKQEMRRAGMSHLLAVSGLHIGIMWAILSLLLRPLVLLTDRGWHRWLILLLLWGYIAVVGFPTSAVRAGVMISMIQISWFLKRDVWGWHNLYSAALLILLFQPSQIYEVGFQLSFLATAGILAAGPWMQSERPKRKDFRLKRRGAFWGMLVYWHCRRLLLVTLSAQFFTFPLVAYYFHNVPLFGWIQGFLVVPVMALFIFLLLTVLVLAFCGLPVQVLSWCADIMSHWIVLVARYTTKIEEYCLGGKLEWYPNLLQTVLLLLALIIIVMLVYRGRSMKRNS